MRVFGDDHAVALGTVVAADGLIVTKASQLTGKLECQLADGRKLPATLVGQDEATDLALLHVDAKNLTPIVWATAPATPGSLVAATGPGGRSLDDRRDQRRAATDARPEPPERAAWLAGDQRGTGGRRPRRSRT